MHVCHQLRRIAFEAANRKVRSDAGLLLAGAGGSNMLDRTGLIKLSVAVGCPGANPYHSYNGAGGTAEELLEGESLEAEEEERGPHEDLVEARVCAAWLGHGYSAGTWDPGGQRYRRVIRHCLRTATPTLDLFEARQAYVRREGFMFTPEGVCTLLPDWAGAAAKRVTVFAEDLLNGSYPHTSPHFKWLLNAAATLGCDELFRADLPDSFGQREAVESKRPNEEDQPGDTWFTCGYFTAGAIANYHKLGWPDMLRDDHAYMATPTDPRCAEFVATANARLNIHPGRRVTGGACYLDGGKVTELTSLLDATATEWADGPMTSDEQLVTLIKMLTRASTDPNLSEEHFIMANVSPFGDSGVHWFPLYFRLTEAGEPKNCNFTPRSLLPYNLGRIGKRVDTRLAGEKPAEPSRDALDRAEALKKRNARTLKLATDCGKPASKMTLLDVTQPVAPRGTRSTATHGKAKRVGSSSLGGAKPGTSRKKAKQGGHTKAKKSGKAGRG